MQAGRKERPPLISREGWFPPIEKPSAKDLLDDTSGASGVKYMKEVEGWFDFNFRRGIKTIMRNIANICCMSLKAGCSIHIDQERDQLPLRRSTTLCQRRRFFWSIPYQRELGDLIAFNFKKCNYLKSVNFLHCHCLPSLSFHKIRGGPGPKSYLAS